MNGKFPPLIKAALREDKAWQDVTTKALPATTGKAFILTQERGILAGASVAKAAFEIRDSKLRVILLTRDGSTIRPGQKILRVQGPLGSILSAERTALNFLSHLSGVATATRRFVDAVKGTGAKIYDTRKTTPGLRILEKYAVRMGGGENHRMDLASSVLLKDNHLKAMREIGRFSSQYLERMRRGPFKNKSVEMEAQNLEEVWEAIAAGVDMILLDNLGLPILKKAMQLITAAREARKSKYPQVEISGGVTLDNVRSLARLKPDRISTGAITHSAPGINFHLELI